MNWLAILKIIGQALGLGLGFLQLASDINTQIKAWKYKQAAMSKSDSSDNVLAGLPKQNAKETGGYVYVVQEVEFSKQFKIGKTVDPTGRLDRIDVIVPGNVEPILIIPTDDALALEKELHRQYAQDRKRGEWFELNQSQVSELYQLQGVVDLASGSNVNPSRVLDPDTLEQAKRLFELISNASTGLESVDLRSEEPSLERPEINSQAAWDVSSVPVGNYHELPRLGGRSGYVCVLRDIETNLYQIDRTDHPAKAIDAAFGEDKGASGIELVMILETANVKEVAKYITILYPMLQHQEWIELSPMELQEIRNLAAPDYIHGSAYLTPKTHWGLANLLAESCGLLPKLEVPAGYVCVVQGVKRGNKYKIWHSRHPKKLASNPRLGLMLNNPYDFRRSSEPIKFRCILGAEYARSLQTFLKERYAAHRKMGDWFELTETQLQEICNLGK